MSDVLIKAENVAKKFCLDLKKSLWYGVKDIASEVMVRKNSKDVLRPSEFWSINDVSFELKRGECLGLIGPNGAGKSTLLKMLNGLIKPDKGCISIRGRVGALIELGAGFNPILTGRENIYVNGAVLGFSRDEIDQKFDAIVDFSEMAEFIDTPVQNYSSGMKVRLGFSIAAQMEPDVLLIDEVLAVGDVGFRTKCSNAINQISKKSAVIFVSHAMPQVARICNSILLLNKGQVQYHGGDVPNGIDVYYSKFDNELSTISGSGMAEILNSKLSSNGKHEIPGEIFSVNYLDDLTIELKLSVDQSISNISINIIFFDKELRGVAQTYSTNSNFQVVNNSNLLSVRVKINELSFNPGIYTISYVINEGSKGQALANYHQVKKFRVVGQFIGFTPIQIKGQWTRAN